MIISLFLSGFLFSFGTINKFGLSTQRLSSVLITWVSPQLDLFILIKYRWYNL